MPLTVFQQSRTTSKWFLYPPYLLYLLVILLPTGAWAGTVLLFVGDGMGLAQREAARLAAHGPDGRLAMDQLDHLALVITHSADALTTDSAAGATAWSTGHRTNNKFLAVDPQGARLPTILERARDAGYGTGLVTTTRITHATPAAFAAHVTDRSSEAEIAEQLLSSRANVLLGGGWIFWAPAGQDSSKRDDGRDLKAEAQADGYQVVRTAGELDRLDLKKTRYLLGLFAQDHLIYSYDRQGTEEPDLATMTRVAIGVLDKFKPGFFLMVEGGRIDHACHNNDATRAIWETIEFDQAVEAGIEYARLHRETLVVVVADHETGGMSVGTACYQGFPQIPVKDGFPERSVQLDSALCIGWTTKGHTAIPVIAGAMGPGAEQFRGVMDNTSLFPIMMQVLGVQAK